MIVAVEGTDVVVRVQTLDSSLSTYTDLLVKWIDPTGVTGESAATVFSNSYLQITLPNADAISGDWYFLGQATTPLGARRKTFGHKVTFLREGEVWP